jgi:hypothetical protein
MSLKTMSVSKLKALKNQVEAVIRTKVKERRREIESELSRLAGFDGSGRAKVVRARTKEMVVRKVGKKPVEPLIANKSKASTRKQRTKTRKASKTRTAAAVPSTPTAKNIEALPVEVAPVEALPVGAVAIDPPPLTSAHTDLGGDDVGIAA